MKDTSKRASGRAIKIAQTQATHEQQRKPTWSHEDSNQNSKQASTKDIAQDSHQSNESATS
jgi:hypothetical protein